LGLSLPPQAWGWRDKNSDPGEEGKEIIPSRKQRIILNLTKKLISISFLVKNNDQ
jgi:hypothetical protein